MGKVKESDLLVNMEQLDKYQDQVYHMSRKIEELEHKLIWLVRHAIFTASISRAKGAEILGVSLIDLDEVLTRYESKKETVDPEREK